jgi:restriction system protein
MINKKELTIRQYAITSEIPLKRVLDVLKNVGFSCNEDDVVNKDMQQKLLKWYRQEYCKLTKEEKAADKAESQKEKQKLEREEQKLARDAKVARKNEAENEVLAFAEKEANEQLPLLIKRGQIMNLCFELLPEVQRNFITHEMNNQKISDVYVQSYYDYLKACFYAKKNIELYKTTNKDIDVYGDNLQDKYWGMRYFRNTVFFEPLKTIFDSVPSNAYFEKSYLEKERKQKHYTSALNSTIYHFIQPTSSSSYSIGELFIDFIGELFIDMGAIDSALKLYEIDQSAFSNPNKLSLLASNAIKTNNLEWAVKLTEQLIKQEPYHPSIPILQADIKRLEQRSRLKSTLSIDFSKIDELSGVEFENLLLDKFTAMGFKAESTPKTGDFGADLIIENSEGSRIIVQCKRFKAKVNLKSVQEVVGAMGHYAGDYGVVITNNSFLNSAVKLAESHDIELWDGDKLVSFLAGDLSFSEIIGTV